MTLHMRRPAQTFASPRLTIVTWVIFQVDKEVEQVWHELAKLGPDAPLPANFPELFYFRLASYIKMGQFADRVDPFVRLFPRENIMFVHFKDLVEDLEGVTKEVLQFVGADPELLKFQKFAPKMKVTDREIYIM